MDVFSAVLAIVNSWFLVGFDAYCNCLIHTRNFS
uniref:Uncharacterized protein n=1 Tax=Arundo donax TaxID=35708 RepID=A0A0A9UWB6_ARUDO